MLAHQGRVCWVPVSRIVLGTWQALRKWNSGWRGGPGIETGRREGCGGRAEEPLGTGEACAKALCQKRAVAEPEPPWLLSGVSNLGHQVYETYQPRGQEAGAVQSQQSRRARSGTPTGRFGWGCWPLDGQECPISECVCGDRLHAALPACACQGPA